MLQARTYAASETVRAADARRVKDAARQVEAQAAAEQARLTKEHQDLKERVAELQGLLAAADELTKAATKSQSAAEAVAQAAVRRAEGAEKQQETIQHMLNAMAYTLHMSSRSAARAMDAAAAASASKAAEAAPAAPGAAALSGEQTDALAQAVVSKVREMAHKNEAMGEALRHLAPPAAAGASPRLRSRPQTIEPIDDARVVWAPLGAELRLGDGLGGSAAVDGWAAPCASTLVAPNPHTGIEVHLARLFAEGTHHEQPGPDGAVGVPAESWRAATSVAAKVFPASLASEVKRRLVQEMRSLVRLMACDRVVSVLGRLEDVPTSAGLRAAVLMERGGAAFVSPSWAAKQARDTGGSMQDLACVGGAGITLGEPSQCGWLRVSHDLGTVSNVLANHGGTVLGAVRTSRTLGELCKMVGTEADRLVSAADCLAFAAHLVGAAEACSPEEAGEALEAACGPHGDDESAAAAVIAWRLLPLASRLRLARESSWAVAEVHLGRSLPDEVTGGAMSEAQAEAWWGEQDKSAGIVHRDVKPDNLLVFDDLRVKAADFGEARTVVAATLTRTTGGGPVGTAPYISPEMWAADGSGGARDRRSQSSDVFSLGLSLAHLFMLESARVWGRTLGESHTDDAIRSAVSAGRRPEWESLSHAERGEALVDRPGGGDGGLAREFWAVLERCWAQEPAERPSAVAVGCALEALRRRVVE